MDITTTVTASVAHDLMARAGIVKDERGRYVIPEEAHEFIGIGWTWATDEALTAALVILATNDEL
jgi:hypothetical protein